MNSALGIEWKKWPSQRRKSAKTIPEIPRGSWACISVVRTQGELTLFTLTFYQGCKLFLYSKFEILPISANWQYSVHIEQKT